MANTAKQLQTTTESASPYLTRAAERYLEQYGDPIVMNTYLKVTILVLAGIVVLLGMLVYRSQMALVNVHPMVIRVNDVGHAESVDYRDLKYRPQEAENKYYLSRWAELYFGRNRYRDSARLHQLTLLHERGCPASGDRARAEGQND